MAPLRRVRRYGRAPSGRFGPIHERGAERLRARSTTRQVLLTLALVAAYAGFLIQRGAGAREAFPVFEWELFSKVPTRVETDFAVRIVAVDGKGLYFPRYFDRAQGLVAQPNSIEASTMSRTMGQAYQRGNDARGEDVRKRFEDRFFAGKAYRYEVVARTYDVKERMSCDCFVEEKVIRTFETEPAP